MTCDGISGGFSDYAKDVARSDEFNGKVAIKNFDKSDTDGGGFVAMDPFSDHTKRHPGGIFTVPEQKTMNA